MAHQKIGKIMSGTLVLEGGAEFGGRMADPDREALAAAGGPSAAVVVIRPQPHRITMQSEPGRTRCAGFSA